MPENTVRIITGACRAQYINRTVPCGTRSTRQEFVALSRHVRFTLSIHFVLDMLCTGNSRDSLTKYKDYGKYRGTRKGYGKNYCKFMVVKLGSSDSDSSSELPLVRLTLKRIRPNELAETKIDPVLKETKTTDEGGLMKVDAAHQEQSTLVVPFKKRRYFATPADENSVTKVWTLEKEGVLSDDIKRPHEAKVMSSDETDSKEEPKDKETEQNEQKQPKAASPQSANEASSSQELHEPCQDEARAGTSAAGVSEPSEDGFCLDALRKKFDQLEFSKVLKDTEFTKAQSDILEQTLVEVWRKMSHIKRNSDRFQKTHKCLNCEFSISHQCMSLDFVRRVPFGTDFLDTTTFAPNRTIICDCSFSFFHAHLKRSRSQMVELPSSRGNCYLREHNRSVSFSCPKCYLDVTLTNRTNSVCSDLANWDRVTGDHRETFYNTIQSCLHYPRDTLLMDEFYACGKGCCLIFHRCSEEAEDPGAKDLPPG